MSDSHRHNGRPGWWWVGPGLFNRPNSRLFKREHLHRAQGFFDRYGARSIVLARFVPIVRTFTPIVAGVSNMHYRTFVRYNAIGGVLWGTCITILGALLGQVAFVRDHIEVILIAIVAISVAPIAVELPRARRRAKNNAASE